MNSSTSLKSETELINHIRRANPSIYLQSKTSTVIPFNHLDAECKKNNIILVDLSQMRPSLNWVGDNYINVQGFVTWQQLKNFAEAKGRRVMTSPTENLASVLAGIATSCTGEHAFGYGTMREQVVECKFINFEGKKITLQSENKINHFFSDQELLKQYQLKYQDYKNFKNGAFPRLQQEIDLMIGSEGQLGVITEVTLRTAPLLPTEFYFMVLPKWEIDYTSHVEIYKKAQKFRGKILSLELLDWNSLSYLSKEDWSHKEDCDVIFMEVIKKHSDEIVEEVFLKLKNVLAEDIFTYNESKFQKLRQSVPRIISEVNAKKNVIKKGTDVQVQDLDLSKLFDYYREFSKQGIKYSLFGHLGDAHLHFNFLPTLNQVEQCDLYLKIFYQQVAKWKASPFAEHGIGIIKQKFMGDFWDKDTRKMFNYLKKTWDPQNIFFPTGFMSQLPSQ